jgi:hypothetical protein
LILQSLLNSGSPRAVIINILPKMNQFPVSVLALIPNRSHLGVAVFRRGRLAFYTSKSLRQYRSMPDVRSAMRKAVVNYERRFGIDLMVVPELNKQQRRSASVVAIGEYLKTLSRSQHLDLMVVDPLAARASVCRTNRPTKEKTALELSLVYPELRRFLISKRTWERRYYGPLFDAVALGVFCTANPIDPGVGSVEITTGPRS